MEWKMNKKGHPWDLLEIPALCVGPDSFIAPDLRDDRY